MLDGRTGHGGGNILCSGAHAVGHAFPARPICCQHDGYWLNHPALSYVFSTIFMAPQPGPRVDETERIVCTNLNIPSG